MQYGLTEGWLGRVDSTREGDGAQVLSRVEDCEGRDEEQPGARRGQCRAAHRPHPPFWQQTWELREDCGREREHGEIVDYLL